MFVEVGDKLFTIVNGLVATSDLNYVYNYEKKIGDQGYPYATITPNPGGFTETIYSSNANLQEIFYNINVFVRNEDIETQEGKIRGIVDAIMVALRDDEYLTGTAHRSNYTLAWGYANDEQLTRVATIGANYSVLIC